MKLNWIEKLIVNSPPRAWVQSHIELPTMLKHAPLDEDATILEVGCGRGKGLKALKARINPQKLHGFDTDLKQVEQARINCPGAYVWQGALPRIPGPESQYDGVFDFGVLHHVPNWQEALKSMVDATKSGGNIYLLEYYRAFICNPIIKRILTHPQENRFSHAELIETCKKHGLTVLFETSKCQTFGMMIVQKP